MMRILLVDDDPGLLRGLARLLSWKREDLRLTTAADGQEAIELLHTHEFDIVLTDLHMPHVNGFDLVAWVLSHKPHISIFAMTAFSDEEVEERLSEGSGVKCFTKPLDAEQLLACLDESFSERMVGHIRNINLTTLLQLMEMEQTSCSLTVNSGARAGTLLMDHGTLVHAETGSTVGDEAAIEIAGWQHASVSISSGKAPTKTTVTNPLRYIMMEACRVMDEQANSARKATTTSTPTDESDLDAAFADSFNPIAPAASATPSTAPSAPALPIISPPILPDGTDALAVVECDTGRVRHHTGNCSALTAVAELASEILRAKLEALAGLGLTDSFEEMVITTRNYASVVRPLSANHDSFALLVFDPSRSTLGMERLVFDGFMTKAEQWLAREA